MINIEISIELYQILLDIKATSEMSIKQMQLLKQLKKQLNETQL
jgi:hypothetical protein